MLQDISIFLEKINANNLNQVAFVGYEPLSLNEAENGTWDACFIIGDEEERYMATINLTGDKDVLAKHIFNSLPIMVNPKNAKEYTGMPGDNYKLYYGEINENNKN